MNMISRVLAIGHCIMRLAQMKAVAAARHRRNRLHFEHVQWADVAHRKGYQVRNGSIIIKKLR